MTVPTGTPQDLRTEVEVRLATADAAGARATAQRLWELGADPAVARFIVRHREALNADRPLREHRLAILRSFTVEPLVPLLEAEAALAGCRLLTWVGAYNAYGQEILSPTNALHAHAADTVILALQARDVTPALWAGFGDLSPEAVIEEIARCVELMTGLLAALRTASGAHILCHGLERPLDPPGGLLDQGGAKRQADALAEVNRRLRAWCAGQPDVHLIDYDEIIERHGRERWFDEKKYAATRLPLSLAAVGWLAQAWWRWIGALALPPAKVLALDLDNTLWGGVLGEDGIEALALGLEPPGLHYRALQQAVLDIARRGVLVVLISKNNEAEALAAIESHPGMLLRREHLADWRINWDAKPANLIALAQTLNLGLDSFVFVDDSPVECEAVRRALPEVEVVELPSDPAAYAPLLRKVVRLERLSLSDEDARRTGYYVEEQHRRDLRVSAVSLEDFLRSLAIEIAIEPISAATLARAAQLTQKTNQLNTTTRRYSEAELARQLEDPAWRGYVLRARDRFGDNGIVGVAITRDLDESCEVETLLLSCRVIGRGLETALLAHLAAEALARGRTWIEGWFRPTTKNAPAAEIYAAAGFSEAGEDASGCLWRRTLDAAAVKWPPWIAGPAANG